MRKRLYPLGLMVWLLACHVHATITVLDYWHMGESDAGATNGGYATNTVDSVGGLALTNQPAGNKYPIYTNNVSSLAAFLSGSLSEYYSPGQYARGNVVANLINNFGMELWVYPVASPGGAVIAYDGDTGGSGWGLFQSGTNCYILFGGAQFSAGSVLLPTNTWTHLAMVSSSNVTTLYTNGAPAFTFNAHPYSPAGSFLIGANNSGGQNFAGAVDEVRVFTFAAGQFSTNDLLVNQPLVVNNTLDSGPGSLRSAVAAATSGSTITFSNSLSGQTITVTNGPISLNSANATIDGSALPVRIILDGSAPSLLAVFSFTNSTVRVNSLAFGGGHATAIYADLEDNNSLTLNNCTFSNFDVPNFGAIMFDGGGTLTASNCTFSGNLTSADGGALSLINGTLNCYNCTFANNSAEFGGALFIDKLGNVEFCNCTFSGNTSDYGDAVGTLDGNGSTLTLINTILADSAPDLELFVPDTEVAEQYLYQGESPQLAPLGNYGGPTQTMPPLPGSPVIDAGGDEYAPLPTDQRGYPRIVGLHVDIGAVEGVYNSAGPGTLTTPAPLPGGARQFSLTNVIDANFPVFATTNLAAPAGGWTQIGFVTNVPPGSGHYQFTDLQATHYPQRFYRVRSP